MKQKIGIALLIAFCFSEMRPLIPYFEYYMNYEYISEILCTNKEVPMTTCNGKCYLNQRLKEAQDTENNEKKLPKADEKERVSMINCNSKIPNLLVTITSTKVNYEYNQLQIKDLFVSPSTPPPKC